MYDSSENKKASLTQLARDERDKYTYLKIHGCH